MNRTKGPWPIIGDYLGAEGQGANGSVSSHHFPAVTSTGTVNTTGGQLFCIGLPDDEDDGALKPLPERLVMELTENQTLALREAIGRISRCRLDLSANEVGQ